MALVVGKVGTGKTSLLMACLGEMQMLKGSETLNGSLAYVGQQPWIMSASIRHNITLGKEFNTALYQEVCEVCCLNSDLKTFEAGDATVVGVNGETLSGGQVQRLALARACYQQSDIIVMDDPLSSVDIHVRQAIVKKCFNGFLKEKTRICVSGNPHDLLASTSHNIFVMDKGTIVESGTFTTLRSNPESKLNTFLTSLRQIRRRASQTGTEQSISKKEDIFCSKEKETVHHPQQAVPSAPTAEYKSDKDVQMRFSSFWKYIAAVDGFQSLGLLIALAICNSASGLYSSYILSKYTTSADISGTTPVIGAWLVLYCSLSCLSVIILGCYYMQMGYIALKGSQSLHSALFDSILDTPISFFNQNPLGSFLNCLSSDIETIGFGLPLELGNTLEGVLNIATTAIFVLYILPVAVLPLVFIAYMFYLLTCFYLNASHQLDNIRSEMRSSLLSYFSDCFQGTIDIRAHRLGHKFQDRLYGVVDKCNMPVYISAAVDNWFLLRLRMLNALVVIGCCFLAILSKDYFNSGSIGLLLVYTMNLSDHLRGFISSYSSLETSLNAVKRVDEYTCSPKEHEDESKMSINPPAGWPKSGSLEFQNVVVSYSPQYPPALKGISFKVQPETRFAIVGRTGAGKSTIVASIFRLLNISSGHILVDGVDIRLLPLDVVRKAISVVPQNPSMFLGTVKENIDPFGKYSNKELWEVLRCVDLETHVASLPNGLGHQLGGNCSDFTPGQLQLLCLCRALLSKCRVVILDEATSFMDTNTATVLHRAIRDKLPNCTVISVTHQLETMHEYDKVIVVSEGRIVEHTPIDKLQEKKDGLLKSMLDSC